MLPEEEVFELDHLQKWALKNDLVPLPKNTENTFIKQKKNNGTLQLANMAKAEIAKEQEVIATIKERYSLLTLNPQNPEARSFKIGESVLKGKVDNIYENGLVFYNVSGENSQAKYLIEAYIKHLFLIASGKSYPSLFLSSSSEIGLDENLVDPAEAKEILKQLIHFFKQGHKEIIPFTPNAGIELMKALYGAKKQLEKEEAITHTLKKLIKDNQISFHKSYQNEYIAKEEVFGYFNELLNDTDLTEVNEGKREQLFTLSELLFKKISNHFLN